MTGSHADSQPSGGRFDGIYGVLAGLEAIQAIQESGVAIGRPLEVVVWSNEEGSRFAPGAMGSMVFTGLRQLDELLDARDADGLLLGDELRRSLLATPEAESRPLPYPAAAYVEAHIEQGPVLEEASTTIGAVTGIQGCRWLEVEVTGEARHAGSTPLSIRRDAMQSAHRIVEALNRHFTDESDTTRFTVGRFELSPNSPNTVAQRAVFTIDFRHPNADVLTRKGDAVAAVAAEVAGPCEVSVQEIFEHRPVEFPEEIVGSVEGVAKELGLSCMKLPSGAFHDAMFMADHCPTGMLFVPSKQGISHHPDEDTRPEDLAAGARVLAEVLVRLANR
jgi:N-carbamoyl-L-amino-acid hydrolase